jgi:hypothetical protein
MVGYADAVKLLGGGSPLVKALDRALGGLLLAATGGGSELAISLFDGKTEAVRLADWMVTGLRDKIKGYGRYDRTQRLQAAHTIIVVTAFFEALEDIGFSARSFSADERRRYTGLDLSIRSLVETGVPTPGTYLDHEAFVGGLGRWYEYVSIDFAVLAEGLAEWDTLSESSRTDAWDRLPAAACRRYEDLHRRLMAEMPEYALWTAEQRQRRIGTVLSHVETVVESLTSEPVPGEVAGRPPAAATGCTRTSSCTPPSANT